MGVSISAAGHHGDLIEGFARPLRSERSEPGTIGDPREQSVLLFAQLIVDEAGSKGRVPREPFVHEGDRFRSRRTAGSARWTTGLDVGPPRLQAGICDRSIA